MTIIRRERKSNTKMNEEWTPHYTGGFSPRQEAQIGAEEFIWVDSRGLHQLLSNQGIEVVLQGNPGDFNNGKIILARHDGFYVEVPDAKEGDLGYIFVEWSDKSIVGYRKVEFKILSITIPVGVSKLAYTLKMYPKKGSPDSTDKRMYVY
jgi:hypothetical protein